MGQANTTLSIYRMLYPDYPKSTEATHGADEQEIVAIAPYNLLSLKSYQYITNIQSQKQSGLHHPLPRAPPQPPSCRSNDAILNIISIAHIRLHRSRVQRNRHRRPIQD